MTKQILDIELAGIDPNRPGSKGVAETVGVDLAIHRQRPSDYSERTEQARSLRVQAQYAAKLGADAQAERFLAQARQLEASIPREMLERGDSD